MKEFFNKIRVSFKAATRGEETVQNMIWWWGAVSYLVAYFIVDRIIKTSNIQAIDYILSLLMIIYFSWHFYALKKCAPKKPKLSKEEKQKLKEEERQERGRKFMRKLLLQESLTTWDPVFVTLVIDVFCVAQFLDYVVR